MLCAKEGMLFPILKKNPINGAYFNIIYGCTKICDSEEIKDNKFEVKTTEDIEEEKSGSY